MNIRSKSFAALFVLLPVSALAFATLDGLTIKRQVKEGQTSKYSVNGQFEVQGTQATFSATDTEKVTKVDTDGTYTIETARADMKAVVNGTEVPIPDAPTVGEVYNADGSLKKINGSDEIASAFAYRLGNLQVLIDPGKPLNVGDTWSQEIKSDSKTGAEAIKADYKILSEEKVGDVNTIKVEAKIKETSGSDPASSEGDYWLDKGDASLVKADVKWTDVPFPGAPAPLSGTLKIAKLN